MVRRAYAQRSVFEVLLPDGDKLWDAELRLQSSAHWAARPRPDNSPSRVQPGALSR